ncbi:hypothetical protein SAMD00020551_4024 [Mesobacillus selenatarsenatis SF-1]|uniref:Uncharacterized protein n=1 Tax=Mesobacillus selenatarsenatis (strain DSM 18680 / JCM 14380 / FERM P-15431 / SF-1) TaxID=1321606 RepID=A0A0A8X9C0_MESS1|nr:hypothetical protein SAMD00020551_4024 [Mesobacillus selenatarsenatis SF-1]
MLIPNIYSVVLEALLLAELMYMTEQLLVKEKVATCEIQ